MQSAISVFQPSTDEEWDNLARLLNGGVGNHLLDPLLGQLRAAGAVTVLAERNYIDRDFSAAYSAFYATLFRPYRKHCTRVHFFSADIADIASTPAPSEQMAKLEAAASTYLGNIVVRPLAHAPVSSAHLAAAAIANERGQEVSVRSVFKVHLLGVELSVEALPLSQQDTRTGACAQATMWMAARHFSNRYGSPWVSMPDITSNALKPADHMVTRSLPAGSDFLTPDNMVRALRAMGRHPVLYAADDLIAGVPVWNTVNPGQVVARYVDSGIPVILVMQQQGTSIGHAVLVAGVERDPAPDLNSLPPEPNAADFITHFLVNDDQRGAYRRLRLTGGPSVAYPFCFDTDIRYLMVPLPEKVFITAEAAELISRDILKTVATQREALAASAMGAGSAWNTAPAFYQSALAGGLVARTYLTYGWKYKARALRNSSPSRLTSELMHTQFPRYVWVTEFSEPTAAASLDPCSRVIRAHAVVDATGSRFWDSVLLVDAPGLSVFWHFDPEQPAKPLSYAIRADADEASYFPKIRGSIDYQVCAAPPP